MKLNLASTKNPFSLTGAASMHRRGAKGKFLSVQSSQTKKIMKLLASLSAILCLVTAAQLTGYSQEVLNPANNHTYYLLAPGTWTSSQAQAVALGGNLVTINDAAENAWVYATFGGTNMPLWIGLTDQASEGNFVWISGEPFTYGNWTAGEPNDNQGEDYAYIVEANPVLQLTPGKWNDYPDQGDVYSLRSVYGVAEVIPEPSSFALASLGVAALLIARRRR
jgi:hypothetical protein